MNTLLDMTPPFTLFLLDAALKSSLLLALLLLADRLLPSAQAAWRNLLWRMGIVGLLLIPAAAAILPAMLVPVSAGWSQTPVVQFAVQSAPAFASEPSARLPPPVIVPPASRSVADSRETPLSSSPPLDLKQFGVALAAALYPAGLLFFLLRLGVGLVSVSLLRRRAVEVDDERCLHHLRALKARLGLRTPVLLSTSETLSGPTQVGCVHPLILLPARTLAPMEEGRTSTILAHELAHVRRGDYLFNLVAGLALALHWFNPLAWLGVRRLRQSSEQACDDWTVEVVGDHDQYARTLVEVAAGVRRERALALGASMATPSRVGRRIERIVSLGGRVSPHIGRIPGTALAAVLISGTLALGASEISSDIPPPLARLLYVTQSRPTNDYTITGVPGCAPPGSEILCFYPDDSHEVVAKVGEDGAFSFAVPYEKGHNGFSIRVRDQQGRLSPATDPRIDKPLMGGDGREPNELGWANLAPASADIDLHQTLINGDGSPEDLKIYGYTPAGKWVTCIARQSGRSFTARVREDGRFSVVIPQDVVEHSLKYRSDPFFLVTNVTDGENHLLAIHKTYGAPRWAYNRQAARDRESLLVLLC